MATEYTHTISPNMLSKADREIQRGVMRTWFFQRYEDPQEECPYDPEEGDYVYIWGGPYDAREELDREFDRVVPQEVINALAEELERDCVEWSAVPEHADVDDYFADAIGSTENPYGNLRTALDSLAQLSNTDVQEHLQQFVSWLWEGIPNIRVAFSHIMSH